MECEEFCLLFSAMAENLNLESYRHVILISGAVITWRQVTARQTVSTDLQSEYYTGSIQVCLLAEFGGVYRWTNEPVATAFLCI